QSSQRYIYRNWQSPALMPNDAQRQPFTCNTQQPDTQRSSCNPARILLSRNHLSKAGKLSRSVRTAASTTDAVADFSVF
ncbi:MAG: hypothetical protein ABJL67_20735, partial [Sulfitobacter sp.]